MRHRGLRNLLMGGLVAFAVSSAGACDSYGDYCEALIDCVDGNDADIDACIVQTEAAYDRASLYGCDEWFDNLQVCVEEESECMNNDAFTPENRCNDEAREFSSCMSDGGFGFPI